MMLILIGIIGFGLLLLADYCGMRNKCSYGNVSGFFGVLIILGSSLGLLMTDYTMNISFTVKVIASLFMIVFLLLLIYSIVIEVSQNNDDKVLITTGTYALTRHPGVLWLFMYYMLGALAFGNYLVIIAGVIWTIVNIVYVILQEKLIFKHVFKNYDTYIKATPMIIPTRSSLVKCLKTINGGRNEKLTRNA